MQKLLLTSLFTLLLACACATNSRMSAQQQFPTLAWAMANENGQTIVRAMPTSEACPLLRVGGAGISMKPRHAGFPDFPDICEALLPTGAATFEVAGVNFRAMPTHPRRIVLLGDTGCRIKQGYGGKFSIQDCNDSNAWPFALIAKSAADWGPDLVVHVGDYHYREAACPVGDRRCAGSASGDNWEAWNQDFFAPAKPLLSAAPWIFTRGNHELCGAGGNGWFQLLDPRAAQKCADRTEPYILNFENFGLGVVDAAEAENIEPSLANLQKDPRLPFWILLHRPFQAKGADDESNLTTKFPAAFGGPGQVAGILAGHRHLFRITEFRDGRPPEFIFGNGGDRLETAKISSQAGEKSEGFIKFGFSTLEEIAEGKWFLTARGSDGQALMSWEVATKVGMITHIKLQPKAKR